MHIFVLFPISVGLSSLLLRGE